MFRSVTVGFMWNKSEKGNERIWSEMFWISMHAAPNSFSQIEISVMWTHIVRIRWDSRFPFHKSQNETVEFANESLIFVVVVEKPKIEYIIIHSSNAINWSDSEIATLLPWVILQDIPVRSS